MGGGPPALHPAPIAAEVSVFTSDGRVVVRQHVRSGQRYRLRLAAGTYWLNAGTQLRYKRPLGCAPMKARVTAGRSVKANVFTGCGIP